MALVYSGHGRGFCVAVCISEFGGGVVRVDCNAGGVVGGCGQGFGGGLGAGYPGSGVVEVEVGLTGAEGTVIVLLRGFRSHDGRVVLVPWDGHG